MGTQAFFPNGTQFQRGSGYGNSVFMTHERLKSRDFIKGDDVYILLTVEGMSIKIVLSKLLFFLWSLIIYCVLLDSVFRYIRDVGGNGHE